jgi:hypothetical protein
MDPAPDDEHRPPGQRTHGRDGAVERDGHQRLPGLVDAGVGVHLLADVQRLLEQLVQGAACRLAVARLAVGGAQLAEDLRLPDDHRVEPGRHREQVLDGLALPVHVQVALEVVERHARALREQVRDGVDARVEAVGVGVHLDPVAGGEHHRLADGAAAAGPRAPRGRPRR